MKPVIALTSGDPGGVGLELAIKSWKSIKAVQPFVLIADKDHVRKTADRPKIIEIDNPEDAAQAIEHGMPLYHVDFCSQAIPGQHNPQNIPGILRTIDVALEWSLSRRVAGICTNPVTKNVFQSKDGKLSGGHTEYLAKHCNSKSIMMLTGGSLRVIPVTIHIPLSDVANLLTQELLIETIRICHFGLVIDFRIDDPIIAVAGLNPHAGEGGQLGSEEIDVIEPVIEYLQKTGIQLTGPHAADSLFAQNRQSSYDVAVCMYHDQALIPIKTNFPDQCVNITLGLSIVRTSPGHGTAFDIAGKGIAKPDGLIAALMQAGEIYNNRNEYERAQSAPPSIE